MHALGHIFSSPELLSQSFLGPPVKLAPNQGELSKEQLRSMEVDLDKDKDSQEVDDHRNYQADDSEEISVDLSSVRRSFDALSSVDSEKYESPLVHALVVLSETLELDLKYGKSRPEVNLLNLFVIVFELPWLGMGEYFENVLPALCRACAFLPQSKQVALVRFWAMHATSNLQNLVQTLQQLISFRVLSGDFGRDYAVNDDDTITACVKVRLCKRGEKKVHNLYILRHPFLQVMRILYCVNIFACTERKKPIEAASHENMDTDDAKDSLDVFADSMNPSGRAEPKQNKVSSDLSLNHNQVVYFSFLLSLSLSLSLS